MSIWLIAAMGKNRVIGQNGRIPWHIPLDFKFFKETTMGHNLIMGRKTFASLPKGPLPGRFHIVITRSPELQASFPNVHYTTSLESALEYAKKSNDLVFIAGGGEIYQQALPLCHGIYLTLIGENYTGDAFFPEIPTNEFDLIAKEDHPGEPPFSFLKYKRKTI